MRVIIHGNGDSVKNMLDSIFFTQLFVPRTSQMSFYPTRETAFAVFSCGSSNVNVLGMGIFMQKVWTMKQKLFFLSGSLAIAFSVILGFKYIFPLVSPFVVAYIIALAVEKPVNKLSKLFRGRKHPASALIVILLALLVTIGVAALLYAVFKEVKNFFMNYQYNMVIVKQTAAKICFNLDGMFGLREGCCMDTLELCARYIEKAINENGTSMVVNRVAEFSLPVLVKIAVVIGGVFVSFISVVYLSDKLDKIRDWCNHNYFREEILAVSSSLKQLMSVYYRIELLIALINIIVLVIGFFIIGNSYAIVLGVIIGILDMLPVFGTGTVLLPWALFELACGNTFSAVVLLFLYAVTWLVREIMESKCVGDRVGISPLVMMIIIFVGILYYGVLGFILGPISYCIVKALILYLKTAIGRDTLRDTNQQ